MTGGSTAWGAFVSQDDSYATVLEKLLNKKYPKLKIRVLVAAAGAYVSTQERIFFENIVLPLKPDILMMFSGWNDSYYGYTGTNILKDHDFLEINRHLLGKIKRLNAEQPNDFFHPPSYENYSSKILLLIDKFFYKLRFPNVNTALEAISRNSRKPEHVYNSLMLNVHIIKQLCDLFNSKFIFYLQPALFATDKKKTQWEKSIDAQFGGAQKGFLDYNYETYKIYRKLIPTDAENNGYIFVDGDEAIKSEKNSVFKDEVHFDDRGNRLIAEHMFNVLVPMMDEIAQKRGKA